MDDYIGKQTMIDASEKLTRDCNPGHFVGHQKFIEYMDDVEIGSFGNWQFANGFNMGLTAAEVAIERLPSADVVDVVRCKDCKWYKTNYSWNGKEHKVCVIEPYEPLRDVNDFCSRGERKDG